MYGTRLKMRTLNKIGLTLGAGCSVLFTGGHDAGAAYRGVANTRAGAAGLFYRAGEAAQGVSTAQAYHLCDTAPNLRAPDRFGMLGACCQRI